MILGNLIRSIRSRRLAATLRDQEAFYASFGGGAPADAGARAPTSVGGPIAGARASTAGRIDASSRSDVASWQLARFNELWRDIPFRVPYYADRMGDLPTQFASWQEFAEKMPVMDRQVIQAHGADLYDPTEKPDYYRTTGGSTAEPVQLPSWARERAFCSADMWHARQWYGVDPGDRLFVMWGHRHLLGSGLSGRARAAVRRLKDMLAGYRRFSAYDVGDEAMRRAGDELLAFRPDYVLGYASALDRFARVNRDRSFAKLGLKVAVATAESFPRADSASAIEAVLGCPVAMEYGCVETGPLAYQHPDGSYHVFWRHYYLEGLPSQDVPGAREVYVTCLHPRCFPLIRYRLGDLIDPLPGRRSIRTRFAAVRGRCDELVRVGESRIHYETFEHVLSRKPWVKGYQIVLGERLRLRYTTTGGVEPDDVASLRADLARLSPALRDVSLERVDALDRTVAGKLCHVIREKAA